VFQRGLDKFNECRYRCYIASGTAVLFPDSEQGKKDAAIISTVLHPSKIQLVNSREANKARAEKETTMTKIENEKPDNFLRTGQVIKMLGVSRMTISRMVRSGTLPAIRLEKNYRFEREAIDRFIESRRVVTA
jgi:excisionase family DNA binding protein